MVGDEFKLGKLEGLVESLTRTIEDERETARFHRQELREKVGQIERHIAVLQTEVKPIAEAAKANAAKLDAHAKEIQNQKIFRTRIAGIVTLATMVMTFIGGGIWWLIVQSWDWIVMMAKAAISGAWPK